MMGKQLFYVLLILAAALPASGAIVVDCWDGGGSSASVSRGFYINEYPGDSIGQVDLLMTALAAGEYTIRMTVRASTYDGTVIGMDEVTATLPLWTDTSSEVNFQFSDAPIVSGTRVTFTMEIIEGQYVYYEYETDNGLCPVMQTDGTTPPLDTHLRDGIRVRIHDENATPAEHATWGTIKGIYR